MMQKTRDRERWAHSVWKRPRDPYSVWNLCLSSHDDILLEHEYRADDLMLESERELRPSHSMWISVACYIMCCILFEPWTYLLTVFLLLLLELLIIARIDLFLLLENLLVAEYINAVGVIIWSFIHLLYFSLTLIAIRPRGIKSKCYCWMFAQKACARSNEVFGLRIFRVFELLIIC